MEYHILNIADVFNKKAHDLFNIYFPNDTRFIFHNIKGIKEFDNFINTHKNNDKMVAVIYFVIQHYQIALPLINKILSYDTNELKIKILYFTHDFWDYTKNSPHLAVAKLMFKAKNHYVITFAENIEQLEFFHNEKYAQYADKYIYLNAWSCYKSSFIEFNENPINKVAVSGRIHKFAYPERCKILSINNGTIEKLDYKCNDITYTDLTYNERLNKYICCFASSVWGLSLSTGNMVNTHIILQKYFEILAVGSLLLCPKSEEKQLNKLGIYSWDNCIMCDMQTIHVTINYILNIDNREIIDGIRRKGQELARNHLNSEKKFHELMTILDEKFSN